MGYVRAYNRRDLDKEHELLVSERHSGLVAVRSFVTIQFDSKRIENCQNLAGKH